MSYSAEQVLLPLQRLQLEHDKLAHQDILGFDLYKRLKHMVLHFYKYAGKICVAADSNDSHELRKILIDTFIICMATANAINVSLGKSLPVESATVNLDALAQQLARNVPSENLFLSSLKDFSIIGGAMAKAMESSDHMEEGNPRAEMARLVVALTTSTLGHLGHLGDGLEGEVRRRFSQVEKKSIFNN